MRVISFIINESHLRQLSAEARSELLQIIGAELADLENEFADREWDPEENKSYPLSTDEAKVLIRGLDRPAKSLLRTLCLNYDGKVGSSNQQEMQDALAWLAGDENRYLMLPNDVIMRCLDQSRFSVLGYRSRHTWYLADAAAIREKCRHRLRNQIPGTLYHVEQYEKSGT